MEGSNHKRFAFVKDFRNKNYYFSYTCNFSNRSLRFSENPRECDGRRGVQPLRAQSQIVGSTDSAIARLRLSVIRK